MSSPLDANADFAELSVGLWNGDHGLLWRDDGGNWRTDAPALAGVLSGSFNPRHDGHEELRSVAERVLNGPVLFELTVVNADKPPMRVDDVLRRLAQFENAAILLTRAATFVEKARLFQGATFVVGVDTAERVVHRRFYYDSDVRMQASLGMIRDSGCRFLVAGRTIGDTFQTLTDVAVPPAYRDLFAEIPAEEFRADVSSSSLRSDRS